MRFVLDATQLGSAQMPVILSVESLIGLFNGLGNIDPTETQYVTISGTDKIGNFLITIAAVYHFLPVVPC